MVTNICRDYQKLSAKRELINNAFYAITNNHNFNTFVKAFSYYWLDKNNYKDYVKTTTLTLESEI